MHSSTSIIQNMSIQTYQWPRCNVIWCTFSLLTETLLERNMKFESKQLDDECCKIVSKQLGERKGQLERRKEKTKRLQEMECEECV